MNAKKIIRILLRTAIFSWLLVCNSIYIVADEKKRDIDWEGTWHEGERSIAPYPIRASYDDTYIYVDASSSHSEFFIQILDSDKQIVFETTLPENVDFQLIPLCNFAEEGKCYLLILTNRWNDELRGKVCVD